MDILTNESVAVDIKFHEDEVGMWGCGACGKPRFPMTSARLPALSHQESCFAQTTLLVCEACEFACARLTICTSSSETVSPGWRARFLLADGRRPTEKALYITLRWKDEIACILEELRTNESILHRVNFWVASANARETGRYEFALEALRDVWPHVMETREMDFAALKKEFDETRRNPRALN